MAHELLEAARAIAPELSRRALEAEQLRTMPPDLVETIRSVGLFHFAMPADLGGPECDAETIFEIVEECSRADGSAGWTIFINNSTSFVAWLDPEVAKDFVAAHPKFIAASMFGPSATATPTDSGKLAINGRWPFNSGSPHADFLMNGVMMMDGDKPRILASGVPDMRFAIFPRSEAEILDTWHVSGLRGTGSHDVVARDIVIPMEHTIAPLTEPARIGGPLFRLPFTTMLCAFMAGFPLGVARRAIDEFVELAGTKGRTIGAPGGTMADDESIQVEVARADAAVRSARAYVLDTIGTALDVVAGGDELPMSVRAQATLATLSGARVARQVVDAICALAGGGALYDSSPLQRCARDAAAGTAHIFLSHGRWKEVGKVLLGKDPNTLFI